ncbi:MAG: Do family serine endopeptidase [Deferribacteraceae bacterium]|jgi:serine protease Do|nr:Do family serine endopeptidase [Deferribacteraceae bacterium]
MKQTVLAPLGCITAFLLFFVLFAPAANAAPDNFVDVVKSTRNGVVHVVVTGTKTESNRPFMDDELFRRFFGSPNERQYKFDGLGTGFIIDNKGLIITNNHVITNADKITVKTVDNKEFEATLVGRDSLTDLALLRIDPKGAKLTALKLGDSDKIEIGEWAVAIGSPQGLEWTVTAGIISAKGRNLGAGPYDSFIQTDASINQGNSGGPLINMNGEVIGVNTMIVANSQGLGFAVPSNVLKNLLPQLMDGRVRRGWLGITLQNIDENLAKSFGLPDTEGALVADVIKGDPADIAGVKSGDVIKKADNTNIVDSRSLTQYVGGKKPGDNIKLTIVRDGKNITVTAKLGERKTDDGDLSSSSKGSDAAPIKVRELSAQELSRLDISGGALVTNVVGGSAPEKAGLSSGDVIVWMNRTDIKSAKQFQESYSALKSGSSVSLKILTNSGSRFIAFNKE